MKFTDSCAVYEENLKKYWPSMLPDFKRATEGKEYVDSEYFEHLFAEAIKVAEEKDVPLYCGECGVIDNAEAECTLNWYKTIHPVFKKYGIGHAAWTYKEMDFGFGAEHLKDVVAEIIENL